MPESARRPLHASEIALNEARAAAVLAERDFFVAQAKKESNLAKKEGLNAKAAEFVLQRETEKRKKELAADDKHHLYRFIGGVDSASCKKCIDQLEFWHRTEPGCDLEIEFFSPGGGVIPGMALFDRILQLRKQGHHVVTTAAGYAASMGGILLQAGDHRVMHQESYLLLHEISAFAAGKLPEMEDEVEFMKKIEKRVLAIFSARSNLSPNQLRVRMKRKDWWIDSDEAMKHKLVDEVR